MECDTPNAPRACHRPRQICRVQYIKRQQKAIRDVELAMFSPAKLGNASLGSGGIGSLEPERSLIIFAGSVPAGINNVFCRATFDGKRRDVRGSVTAFTEDQVPIFTITFE
jgi:hypothetical protein